MIFSLYSKSDPKMFERYWLSISSMNLSFILSLINIGENSFDNFYFKINYYAIID
jgi:hypothetical protein